ncbi:MAG: NAD(P)-binding domain-containing protein [Anaerolineae bacterium]|nr:NAD(P)-binding domain-containing protein [Anaerolineae bacterium]
MRKSDTLVIGAGQAGLSISYYLTQAGREHVILEKARVANAWRDHRWDSFTLVTPSWTLGLPDTAYDGDDPEGFLTRREVVDYLEAFAGRFDPPVQEGVEVTAVEAAPESDGFIVRSSADDFQVANVVVAAGLFQRPRIPALSERLADSVKQIHTSEYRNHSQLLPGAVLVVGSGQSGAQIAEELREHGREVYLATGRTGRLPRRYRGKDGVRWMARMGMVDKVVELLPSPAARFASSPHVSGKEGGRTLNLHQFSRDGITLLGHLLDGRGTQLEIAPDLYENLAAADKVAREFKQGVDTFIEKQGLQAPEADESELRDRYDVPVITELDLASAGISTIIWATGYRFDFSWVKVPIFDEFGYPVQQRGVTSQAGLYFLGLPWLHTIKSGLLWGVGEDAAHVAEHIARDARRTDLLSCGHVRAGTAPNALPRERACPLPGGSALGKRPPRESGHDAWSLPVHEQANPLRGQ